MGLFSKLKQSMDHGVVVHVQAPSSAPSDQVIPVQVMVTSSTMQTVNVVKAEIKAQAKEQGIRMGGGPGMGVNSSETMTQTVAQVESREPFTINPGETKTINLQLFMNGTGVSGNPMAQMRTGAGGLGGVLQSMAVASQAFEHINYLYSVHASLEVQGLALHPSDKQPIQILPPAAAPPPTQAAQANNIAPVPNTPQPPQMPAQPIAETQQIDQESGQITPNSQP